MNKEIIFDDNVKQSIRKGIEIVSKAVSSTLGPKGKTVIIEQSNGSLHITKDGVTVARSIQLKNRFENVGVQLIKEVADKMCSICGDGTSSSVVLTNFLIEQGSKLIELGENPIKLKKELEVASKIACDFLEKLSIPLTTNDQIQQIATISANNDSEIGKLIAEAFSKITTSGVIVVEESKNSKTFLEIINGMQFDRGYLSPHFVTNFDKNICELDNPYILINLHKVLKTEELVPILNQIVHQNRSILLIAEDFEPSVLEDLKLNCVQKTIKVCAIKAPEFGEYREAILNDLATITGGTCNVNDSGCNWEESHIKYLGQCDKIIVTKNKTIIYGNKGDQEKICKKVNRLKEYLDELKKNTTNEDFLIDFTQKRISRLVGGIALLHIGGYTELEMKERKDRADDAIAASKAAIEEGIVPGGGLTYLEVSKKLLELKGTGNHLLADALMCPFYTILSNIGYDRMIVSNIATKCHDTIGFDANIEEICDLIENGIIDPVKVSKEAIINAISVASLMLTTNCIITNENLN